MGEPHPYPSDRLALKQTGSRRSYFLDGRMVSKGMTLEVSDGLGGWLSGRFDGAPLSNKPPTLLCSRENSEVPGTHILDIFPLSGDARLRWPN
jgi:hypothetical protein